MKKRIAAILLLGCMVMGSIGTQAQVSAAEVAETVTETETETEQTSEETPVDTAAAESTETVENTETAESTESAESVKAAAADTTENETEATTEEITHPTGLMDLNVINVGTIAEDDVLDETEANSSKSSSVYAAAWDAYSSNYVYNMLSTEERKFWDGLDASCRQVLLGTDNLTDGTYTVCILRKPEFKQNYVCGIYVPLHESAVLFYQCVFVSGRQQQRMVCGIRCLFCLSEWYGEKHCNTECEESGGYLEKYGQFTQL